MFKKIKTYLIGLPILWLSILILIYLINKYNKYIYSTYTEDHKLTVEASFKILNDSNYFHYLISGFVGIFLLVFFSIICLIQGLKNIELNSNFIYISIVGPVVNIALLVWLLIVFSNPILVVFAITIFVSGLFIISQS